MSDDSAALKAQATARFNTMAAEFDEQGAFAHFGRRLVELLASSPGSACSTWRPAVVPCSSQPPSALARRAKRSVSTWPRTWSAPRTRRPSAAAWARPSASWMPSSSTFPDAAFDRVLCGFGLMFFPHQDQALAEFRRVLKPGGRLGVSTWRASQAEDLQAVLEDLGLLETNSSAARLDRRT